MPLGEVWLNAAGFGPAISRVQIPEGLPTKRGLQMSVSDLISIIFSFCYCEIVWGAMKRGTFKPASAQRTMKILIVLNLVLAVFIRASGNLYFGLILLLYYLVLIPKRLMNP